ncbi:antibiotic biosynthesis monooxygenase family protein [Marisediminicola senii]|uniref:antibiotic biosynthesis monooxygenase family protein n=1 Tax=Marisediminicola senii TaxID=2711233 RepID=UPI0013EC8ECB|nr:antibiotic biosynthesis monooxygenase [Marisediminicola senii]
MSIIKINAITVPADSGDELAHRFAARAGAVDGQPGFEGFELLKPTDDRTTWLVITRWSDDASFQAWVESPSFAHGHRGGSEKPDGAASTDAPAASAADAPHAHAGRGPVGISAELWSYEPAGGSTNAQAANPQGTNAQG